MPKIDVSDEVIAKLSDDATKSLARENAALKRKLEKLERELEILKRDKEQVKRLTKYFQTIYSDLRDEFGHYNEDW